MSTPTKAKANHQSVQELSQKALFLALYAKYIGGEKRMNEDSEMILGPQDGGVTLNKELSGISAMLEDWFSNLQASGRQSQGWLEYLYGIVLAKGKNEKLALDYLIRSVHLYPYNWGAWQELTNLLGTAEEVSKVQVFRSAPDVYIAQCRHASIASEYHDLYVPHICFSGTLPIK